MVALEQTTIYQNEYQQRAELARQEFASRPIVKEIFVEKVEPKLFKLFMIHWSALSAGISQPIPEYFNYAAERCKNEGFGEMAEVFSEHGQEEDGHENWATTDVQKLVEIWNQEEPNYPLDAQKLLAQRMSPAVKRYHKLHEDVIKGDYPWAELAIGLEIELIATTYGPILLERCVEIMGKESIANISFLDKHVTADVGHTETNFEVVDKFICDHPESKDILVKTAGDALNSYADFLEDAMTYAKKVYARM